MSMSVSRSGRPDGASVVSRQCGPSHRSGSSSNSSSSSSRSSSSNSSSSALIGARLPCIPGGDSGGGGSGSVTRDVHGEARVSLLESSPVTSMLCGKPWVLSISQPLPTGRPLSPPLSLKGDSRTQLAAHGGNKQSSMRGRSTTTGYHFPDPAESGGGAAYVVAVGCEGKKSETVLVAGLGLSGTRDTSSFAREVYGSFSVSAGSAPSAADEGACPASFSVNPTRRIPGASPHAMEYSELASMDPLPASWIPATDAHRSADGERAQTPPLLNRGDRAWDVGATGKACAHDAQSAASPPRACGASDVPHSPPSECADGERRSEGDALAMDSTVVDYVEKHQLPLLFESMIAHLLAEKPLDVDGWMAQWFYSQWLQDQAGRRGRELPSTLEIAGMSSASSTPSTVRSACDSTTGASDTERLAGSRELQCGPQSTGEATVISAVPVAVDEPAVPTTASHGEVSAPARPAQPPRGAHPWPDDMLSVETPNHADPDAKASPEFRARGTIGGPEQVSTTPGKVEGLEVSSARRGLARAAAPPRASLAAASCGPPRQEHAVVRDAEAGASDGVPPRRRLHAPMAKPPCGSARRQSKVSTNVVALSSMSPYMAPGPAGMAPRQRRSSTRNGGPQTSPAPPPLPLPGRPPPVTGTVVGTTEETPSVEPQPQLTPRERGKLAFACYQVPIVHAYPSITASRWPRPATPHRRRLSSREAGLPAPMRQHLPPIFTAKGPGTESSPRVADGHSSGEMPTARPMNPPGATSLPTVHIRVSRELAPTAPYQHNDKAPRREQGMRWKY